MAGYDDHDENQNLEALNAAMFVIAARRLNDYELDKAAAEAAKAYGRLARLQAELQGRLNPALPAAPRL